MAILNTIDILHKCFKLKFGPLQGHVAQLRLFRQPPLR